MSLGAYKASLLVCRRYYFMYNTSLFVCIGNHCVYKARIRIFKGVVVCVSQAASWVKKLCVKKAMLYVCIKRGCGVSIRHSSVCKAFLCVYKASLCVDVRFPCLFVSGVLVHTRRRWSAYAIVMCVVHHGINTLHVTTVYVPSGTFSSDFNEQFSELIGVLLSLPGKHVIVGDF